MIPINSWPALLTENPVSGGTPARTPYHFETMRPVVSLLFIAPILLAYELACILFDQPTIRTGIDQWLHQVLATLGIGQMIVLPIVTAAVLLHMHHRRRDHWKMNPAIFLGMIVESVGLGLILFFGATTFHQWVLDQAATETLFSIPIEGRSDQWWSETFGYFGAGIYEELVFRLLLLPAVIGLIAKGIGKGHTALVTGLIITSLLFALSHYNIVNPAGASLELGSFLFRFLASVMFGIVFLYRGFGVAVGTHVAYDVLTQI